MKKNILVGLVVVILSLIIISSYFLHFNKVAEERITRSGIFISSCNLENYDECISRIGTKSGPWFYVCWGGIRTIDEAIKNSSNCVNIISPLDSTGISDSQLQDFKNYLNREVEVTGFFKTIKWGVSGPDCNMVQIGCERDLDVFVLENIEIISE